MSDVLTLNGKVITDEDLYKSVSNSIELLLIEDRYKNMRFYGYMLLTIQKEFVDYSPQVPIFTAGIGLIGLNYKLFINRKFWIDKINMSKSQRVGLLVHEVMHVIYNHPLMGENYPDHNLHNEATDLFINSVLLNDFGEKSLPGEANTQIFNSVHKPALEKLMQDLSDKIIDEETFKKEFEKIPIRPVLPDDYNDPDISIRNCINKGSDWIYQKLFKIKENNNQSSGSFILDLCKNTDSKHPSDHKDWDGLNKELTPEVKDFIKNQQEFILKQALEEFDKSQGNMPAYLRELLDKILNPPKPVFDYVSFIRNWVSIFGNFTQISRTRSKPTLIIPDLYRLAMKPDKYIFVSIDTSGSMSKQDFKEVFTELCNIKRITNCKIDVAEIDTTIHNVWELKDVHQMNEYLTQKGISGRGGTEFTPAVSYTNDNPKYSGHIYLTDGWVSPPSVKSNIPILVVVSSKGSLVDWAGITSCQIPIDYLKTK